MQPHTLPLTQNVSRETFVPLQTYIALLLKWNEKINLIGPATASDVWKRHVEDALQLLPYIPATVKTLADLGSGAGLPGIIIGMMRPDLEVTLVEVDQRKSAFLLEAKRILSLGNITVETKKIQTVARKFDMITARALAPLRELFALTLPLLKPTSLCLFLKGENALQEITHARHDWSFDCQTMPSRTHPASSILCITALSPIGSA